MFAIVLHNLLTRCLRVPVGSLMLMVIIPVWATATPTSVMVDDDLKSINIRTEIQSMVDTTRELGIQDLLQEQRQDSWQQQDENIPNFGFTTDTYWLQFNVVNSSRTINNYLLVAEYPLLDHLDCFITHEGAIVESFATGDQHPFGSRPIPNHTFVFPLNLATDEQYSVFLKVQTDSAMQIPLSIRSLATHADKSQNEYYFTGQFFGVLLAVILYSTFVFISIRDRNYLYFMIYTVLFMGIPSAMNGYGYQFLWPNSPWFQNQSVAFFMTGSACAACWYSHSFLQLNKHSITLSYTFRILGVLSLVATPYTLILPYAISIKPILAMVLFAEFLVLGTAIWVWRKTKSQPSILFAAAWGSFLLGTMLMIVSKIGWIPRTFLTESGPSIGILIEAMLMSVALAGKVKQSRFDKHKAQSELIKFQEESAKTLRDEVQSKTQELQGLLRQLAKTNEELEGDNKLDGLTNIFNRRALDEKISLEHEDAIDHQESISALMIDIDHFKNFNDTYGHQVGDDCLIQVAKVIKQQAQRTTDYAARYGGEEFVVLLVDTALEDACVVGERIRSAIEDMEFLVDEERVPVTVSIGASTCIPTNDIAPDFVISQADAALYKAKENGRNRVELQEHSLEPVTA